MACGGQTKRTATTVSTAAVGLTMPTGMVKPLCATIQVKTDAVFYTTDGSTPSSTVGFEAAVGTIIGLTDSGEVKRFKAIRKTTDATLEAEFGSDMMAG